MNEKYILNNSTITYLQSPLFLSYSVPHAFTTRLGGVSKGVFTALNLACGAGDIKDSAENVFINHDLVAQEFGLTAADVCRTLQLHTDFTEYVNGEQKGIGLTKPAFDHGVDGLVTDCKGMLLSVRAADCVPILLYDLKAELACGLHSGWRGTEANAVKKALEVMKEHGSEVRNIIAAVGPCIKKCCYVVGEELHKKFVGDDLRYDGAFEHRDKKLYFDMTYVIGLQLADAGISDDRISICGECTCCNSGLFYSHRRDGVNRGTMGGFIMCRNGEKL